MVEIIVLNHLASHRSQLKTRRSFTFFQPCLVDLTGVSGTLSVPNISLIDIICHQGCLLCYKINVSEKYLSTLLAQLTAV